MHVIGSTAALLQSFHTSTAIMKEIEYVYTEARRPFVVIFGTVISSKFELMDATRTNESLKPVRN